MAAAAGARADPSADVYSILVAVNRSYSHAVDRADGQRARVRASPRRRRDQRRAAAKSIRDVRGRVAATPRLGTRMFRRASRPPDARRRDVSSQAVPTAEPTRAPTAEPSAVPTNSPAPTPYRPPKRAEKHADDDFPRLKEQYSGSRGSWPSGPAVGFALFFAVACVVASLYRLTNDFDRDPDTLALNYKGAGGAWAGYALALAPTVAACCALAGAIRARSFVEADAVAGAALAAAVAAHAAGAVGEAPPWYDSFASVVFCAVSDDAEDAERVRRATAGRVVFAYFVGALAILVAVVGIRLNHSFNRSVHSYLDFLLSRLPRLSPKVSASIRRRGAATRVRKIAAAPPRPALETSASTFCRFATRPRNIRVRRRRRRPLPEASTRRGGAATRTPPGTSARSRASSRRTAFESRTARRSGPIAGPRRRRPRCSRSSSR